MTNGSVDAARMEIVLAEDISDDITATLSTLKKANIGNCVHVLREGRQVLDFLFRTGPFADLAPPAHEFLILLSLKLADEHGLDLLRRIKGDERTRGCPVIILTSSQEERGVMQSYKLGANACIVKPLELAKFVEAVAELRLGWLLVAANGSSEKPAA